MTTQMVRKQFYIRKRQDELLKLLAKARGLSESEIIRQAIEHEAAGDLEQSPRVDRSAWQEMIAFLEQRQKYAGKRRPYQWNRDEIYSERESRWFRDDEQD